MDSECLYLIGTSYAHSRDYDSMKKYYLMAIEHEHVEAMNDLGMYYHVIEKDYDLMKKYYLMAIEGGNTSAMNKLGMYYDNVEKNYELLKKYYLMAIDGSHEHTEAMNNLGLYYKNVEKNYDNMKKYYRMAIEHGHIAAMNNLAYYYETIENNYNEMKKYYLMAIEGGYITAKIKLKLQRLELFCNEFKTKTITSDKLCLIYDNNYQKLLKELGSIYAIYKYSYIMNLIDEISEKIYGKTCIAECPICTETTECGHYPCDERHKVCRDCYWKSPTQCYYKCK